MEFGADASWFGWIGVAVIAIVAFWAMMIFLEADGTYITDRIFGWHVVIALLISIGGVQAGAAITSNSQPLRDVTASDLAAHFGLQSGQEYPLIISQQGGGTIGNASAYGGLFGSSAVVDLRPTSTVSIGFQNNESWWQLTLPTDTVEYRSAVELPSVTVWLDDTAVYGDGNKHLAYWEDEYSACTWKLHNFWIQCEKEIISSELIVSPEVERAGLANVVNQHFASARINLTDEQHAELFPTN